MAAGQGFKTFTTGEVLTAGDVNGYLMQGINVFANATARNAAITSPQEGQFAFTKDNNSLWYYDGAAWVASGATGDIEGVTAGVGISGGGTSGTVTVTNSMATAIDAKGDLVPGTGADTFARLPVGTNGQVLTADSAEATGLKWATPASGSMTLLHTITLSTTSHTQSSISQAYKNLYVVGQNLGVTAGGAALRIQVAGRTGNYVMSKITGSTVGTGSGVGFDGESNDLSNTNGSACQFTFYDYAETSSEKLTIGEMVGNNTGSVTFFAGSPFNLQTNIASVTITTVGGTADLRGTILIYGVN
jgi:hypothetical protein